MGRSENCIHPDKIRIDSLIDIKEIEDSAEKEFARLIFSSTELVRDRIEIVHEPTQIFYESQSTIPDFGIRNKKTGRITYIEITRSSKRGILNENREPNGEDPKEKQKKIMKNGAPDKRCVYIYGEELGEIQARRPELGLNFFDGNGNGH